MLHHSSLMANTINFFTIVKDICCFPDVMLSVLSVNEHKSCYVLCFISLLQMLLLFVFLMLSIFLGSLILLLF